MKIFLTAAIVLVLGCATKSLAPEERALQLGRQLRCPVCRGVPIAESPAALAQEMMGEVRRLVAEGKSDEEILAHFQARYGEWVLLQPKAEGMNLMIWFLPALFLVTGGVLVVRFARRKI